MIKIRKNNFLGGGKLPETAENKPPSAIPPISFLLTQDPSYLTLCWYNIRAMRVGWKRYGRGRGVVTWSSLRACSRMMEPCVGTTPVNKCLE